METGCKNISTYGHRMQKHIYIWTQDVKTYLHMDTGCKNVSTYGHRK